MNKIILILVLFFQVTLGWSQKTKDVNAEYKNYYIYTQATKLKLLRQYDKSLSLFKKYLEINPKSDGSNYQIAQIYLMYSEYDKAELYIKRAIELNENNVWYYYFLGSIYKVTGNINGLIDCYTNIINIKGEDDELLYELVNLYIENGDSNKANLILENLESKYGKQIDLAISKYRIVRRTSLDSSLIILKDIIKVYPNNANLYGILAEHFVQMRNFEEASVAYDSLFEIDSLNIEGKISYANFLMANKKVKKSIQIFSDVLRNGNVTNSTKLNILIGFLENENIMLNYYDYIQYLVDDIEKYDLLEKEELSVKADFELRSGNYNEALILLKEVLNYDDSNYLIWEQIILIENQLQHNDSVIYYSDKALNIFKGIPNLYLINGIGHFQNENYEDAIDILLVGLDLNTNKVLKEQFLTFLAESYYRLKEYKKSDKLFQQLIAEYPDNIVTKNNYAYYLSLRNVNLKYAKKLSKETIIQEPKNGTFLDTYAWILFQLKKYKEALKYIEKAIVNGNASNPEVLEHAGDILIMNKKSEDALYMYKRAYDILPSENLLKKIQEHE